MLLRPRVREHMAGSNRLCTSCTRLLRFARNDGIRSGVIPEQPKAESGIHFSAVYGQNNVLTLF